MRSSKSSALAARSRRWYSAKTSAMMRARSSCASDASAAACSGPISSFLRFEIPLDSNRGEYRLVSSPMSLPIISSSRRESSAS